MPLKKKKRIAKKRPVKRTKGLKKKPAVKKITKKILPKKKVIKKKVVKPKKPKVEGVIVGKITHYFPHVNAAVVKLKLPLKIGDSIRIKGHTTDLNQAIASMQIDRAPINEAKKGDEIGLLVTSRVRAGDVVYKKS